MAKIHLVASEFPLKDASGMTLPCGKELLHGTILAVWDNQHMNCQIDIPIRMGACRKCYEVLTASNIGTRYVYGVTEGEK